MKYIPNETFDVNNLTCVNLDANNKVIFKCIFISDYKFEIQLMNLDYYKKNNSIFSFKYFQNSGDICISNGTISIPLENNNPDNIKVLFNDNKYNDLYKLKYNVSNNLLSISVMYINTSDIIKEDVFIKYYDKSLEIFKFDIKNFTNEIYSTEITTSFKLYKSDGIRDNTITGLIPKTIIQTYNTRHVNIHIYNATRTWTLLNPNYKYIIFDNEECRTFIKNNFQPIVLRTFDGLIPGAFKADLFRYCYLYKKGGVYSDIDNMCLVPMDSIINKTDSFLSVKDRPHSTIFNSFIATKPDNPVLHECIQKIVYNVTHRVYYDSSDSLMDALTYTGPRCLGISLNKYLNRNLNSDFSEGIHTINNIAFTLFINNKNSFITFNNKRLIKIKYEGYKSHSNYWKLATQHKIYK
tara:strand:+ start:189 stop:1415 length:1227 start_codon:yes stop_codon:yes gene_type:complete